VAEIRETEEPYMAKKWKLRWREAGRHCQRSFDSRAERDKFARERFEKGAELPWVTFGEFAERWLREIAPLKKSSTTVKEDERVIRRHLIPALADVQLRDLRKSTLLGLRGKWAATPRLRGGKPISIKTVNNIVGIAKAMVSDAVDLDLLPKNPWLGIEALRAPERRMGFWSPEERDAFLGQVCQRERAFWELVLVATHTGLRKGELKALQVGQLDFDRRQIRVDATFDEKTKTRRETTKNGKCEFVAMSLLVAEVLVSRRGEFSLSPVFAPELFADFNGRLERRAKEFGLPVIRVHDLRHTFASCLVMEGVPLYTVQKLMRHGSIAMTERYAHLASSHLHEAVDKLCARNVRVLEGEVAKVLEMRKV
jgi:integrase